MKINKIIIILALALAALGINSRPARAFSGLSGFAGVPGNQFNIDARDSHNRPVKSPAVFRDTVFSRVYAQISPFGIARRVSIPSASEKLRPDLRLELPRLIFSFFYGSEEFLLRPSESVSHPMGASVTGLPLLLLCSFMMIFCIRLQSSREPRFRVPLFLE